MSSMLSKAPSNPELLPNKPAFNLVLARTAD